MLSDTVIVAVYGSLKRGFYNHRLLERSRFMATGTVAGFTMYSLGAFPMIVEGTGSVAVELYEVDRQTLAALDRLEGFPSFYQRQIVTAQTDCCPVEAWIYHGKPEQVKGQRRIQDGVWRLTARGSVWA